MHSNQKKIAIVLLSQIHVRNYVDTGAFEKLASKFQIKFFIRDSVTLSKSFECEKEFEIIASMPMKNHWRLFELFMFMRRPVSSTFRFRIKRLYFPPTPVNADGYIGLTKYKLRQIKRFFLWILFSTLALPGLNICSLAIFRNFLEKRDDLEEKIRCFGPDLVIMPSSAYEPLNMEMIRITRNLGAKTLMVVDNWDNLSSKSVMYEQPDFLSVWGEQSVDHCKLIHNIPAERVFIGGTPRFDDYFLLRAKKLKNNFNFRYLLFVGTALEFDERRALQALDCCISKNSELKHLRIIYRPHPWRQSNDIVDVTDLPSVQLDPQIASAFSNGDKTQQPDLSYYPSLLQNAEGVVGGMTTMLIEALLMRTPYLALVWDDPKYATNMRDVYDNYMHFRGTEGIGSLMLSRSESGLSDNVSRLCEMKSSVNGEELDNQLNYFYNVEPRSFSDRLNSIVTKVI